MDKDNRVTVNVEGDGQFADKLREEIGKITDIIYEKEVKMEVGTLQELNVKPGDVVQNVYEGTDKTYTATVKNIERGNAVYEDGSLDYLCGSNTFRIVSRADDTPKLWRDMTDEEKGALLLAHHEGKVIEAIDPNDLYDFWEEWRGFSDDLAYRVKPEPVWRATVEMYGGDRYGLGYEFNRNITTKCTHRITFETVDGKPDCSTIKMEEL